MTIFLLYFLSFFNDSRIGKAIISQTLQDLKKEMKTNMKHAKLREQNEDSTIWEHGKPINTFVIFILSTMR